MGATLLHREYIRELLKFRKIRDIHTISSHFPCTGTIASSSLSLAKHSHDLQNSKRSTLAKDTTLNTKKPTSRFAKHDEFQIVPSNFPTNYSSFEA
jgi:hypothetical protein